MAAEVSFYRKFRRKFKSHMSLYPNLSLPSKKAADFISRCSKKIQKKIWWKKNEEIKKYENSKEIFLKMTPRPFF